MNKGTIYWRVEFEDQVSIAQKIKRLQNLLLELWIGALTSCSCNSMLHEYCHMQTLLNS